MTFVSSSRLEASRRGRLAGSRFGNNVKRPAESKSASLDAWDAQLAVMRRREPPQPMGLRIALLIDAENITYKNVDGIMNEVEKLGVVQVRRIYADWTSEVMRGWRQTVLTNALTPIHQFQSSLGKGNSDSALIIDAMDILFKNKDIESFCIVSSDADFTRLATKLREEGKLVLGIGSNYTPAPFVVACNRFVYLHNLTKDDSSAPNGNAQHEQQQQQEYSSSRKSSSNGGGVTAPSLLSNPQQQQQQQGKAFASKQPQPQQQQQPSQAMRHVLIAPPAAAATAAATKAGGGGKQQQQQQQQGKKLLDLTLPSLPAMKRAVVQDVAESAAAAGMGSSSELQTAAVDGTALSPEQVLSMNTEKLLPLLTRAWAQVRQDSGWASSPHLTAELLRISPELDAASYGKFSKLEDLFELAVQGFEVKKQKGRIVQVRRVMAGRNEVASEAAGFDDEDDDDEDEADELGGGAALDNNNEDGDVVAAAAEGTREEDAVLVEAAAAAAAVEVTKEEAETTSAEPSVDQPPAELATPPTTTTTTPSTSSS